MCFLKNLKGRKFPPVESEAGNEDTMSKDWILQRALSHRIALYRRI